VAICLCLPYSQLEPTDQKYVEECLKLSAVMIARDICISAQHGEESIFVDTLGLLLDQDNKYYEEMGGKVVRIRVIDVFQTHGGFGGVAKYLSCDDFPLAFKFLRRLVDASVTLIVVKPDPNEPRPAFTANLYERRKDAILVGNAILGRISTIPLASLDHGSLAAVEHVLSIVYHFVLRSTSEDVDAFYKVYFEFTLRLLTSESGRLQAFGWKQTTALLVIAGLQRPPARAITVSKAGCAWFNGVYSFIGIVRDDGYVNSSDDILYKRVISAAANGGAGKVLTISAENAEGGDRRWSLGSDLEMDLSGSRISSVTYYEADSGADMRPPANGWKPASNTGIHPGPTLHCHGAIVPSGKEYSTVDHQFAKWVIDNRVLELAFSENRSPEWLHGLLLMKFVSDVGTKSMKRNDGYLKASHTLIVWSTCVNSNDTEITIRLCHSLASVFPHLSDEIALKLLTRLHEDIAHQWCKAALFCDSLIHFLCNGCEKDTMNMSNEVKTELQKLFWRIRMRMRDAACQDEVSERHETFMVFESLCASSRKPIGLSGTQSALFGMPRSPTVSVVDHERRQIRVSMPIESVSGEFLVGMHVVAKRDDGDKELVVGSIDRDAIECRMMEGSDKATVEVILPEAGIWELGWQGVLLKSNLVETPRSTLTCVDLTLHAIAQEKQKRTAIDAMEKKAKKQAGDIQSVVQKLRGPCSGQMDANTKFSMLDAAMERGRSTLISLRSLVEASGTEEASVSGIARLSEALATALPVKTDLAVAYDSRGKKLSGKEFKVRVAAVMQSGEAAVWLKNVSAHELESFGGDSNRLFQLLVEGKGGSQQPDEFTLEAASARADLFSKKQIKTLSKHKLEVKARGSKVAQSMLAMSTSPQKHIAPISPSTVKSGDECQGSVKTKQPPKTSDRDEQPGKYLETSTTVTVRKKQVTSENRLVIPVPVAPTARELDETLLRFLEGQANCLRGSPEAYHYWLSHAEYITNIKDLSDAVSDDVYFKQVLLAGDGTVGIKKFKRLVFKSAVHAASDRAANTSPTDTYDKENSNLSSEIEAANEELAVTVKGSRQAQAIVERGALSPNTHERMTHPPLNWNTAVRIEARDAAISTFKGRVPLGRLD